MDLDKVIKERRSIRFFKKKLITRSDLKNIIESAIWAPSACNIQGWRFIVINDKNKLQLLSDNGGAYFIRESPQAILIIYDNRTDNIEYRDYIQSASAAIQNMQLKIFSMGFGSCWVNNLPKKSVVRKIFNIPNFYDPIALVVLGYPRNNNILKIKRKFLVDSLVSYNIFHFNNLKLESKSGFFFIRKYLRLLYINSPFVFRRLFQPFIRKFEKNDFS